MIETMTNRDWYFGVRHIKINIFTRRKIIVAEQQTHPKELSMNVPKNIPRRKFGTEGPWWI
jgi:hypothetical protein